MVAGVAELKTDDDRPANRMANTRPAVRMPIGALGDGRPTVATGPPNADPPGIGSERCHGHVRYRTGAVADGMMRPSGTAEVGASRCIERGTRTMKKNVMLVLLTILAAGCGREGASGGPLGVVGAIVTAPVTIPVMTIAARVNDREAFLESARRNQRPLPPIDVQSRRQAAETLALALSKDVIDKGVYWQNDKDASGYAAVGGVTVLATGRTDDGRTCREVLIETGMAQQPTDQRVRTFCRDGSGWRNVPAEH